MLEIIKAAGYRVFMRPGADTYCYYTDGTLIGYAQWGRNDVRVTSVHVPNRNCGTGFAISDTINAATLRAAMTCTAPHWATGSDRASVKKYRDFDAFLKSSKFNSELLEV